MLRKAFTLIELLIVMTVIAILAGILIPSFRGYQSEAWIIKAEGDIGALQLGVEAYFRKHTNEYPDAIEAISWGGKEVGTWQKFRNQGDNHE